MSVISCPPFPGDAVGCAVVRERARVALGRPGRPGLLTANWHGYTRDPSRCVVTDTSQQSLLRVGRRRCDVVRWPWEWGLGLLGEAGLEPHRCLAFLHRCTRDTKPCTAGGTLVVVAAWCRGLNRMVGKAGSRCSTPPFPPPWDSSVGLPLVDLQGCICMHWLGVTHPTWDDANAAWRRTWNAQGLWGAGFAKGRGVFFATRRPGPL